jgi:hypothetical protein
MEHVGISEWMIVLFTIIIIVISFAAAIIPMVLVFKYIAKMSGQKQQLLATGQPAQARVIQMGHTGTTINDSPMVQLMLEVHPQPVQGPQGYRGAPPPFQTQAQILVPMLALPRVQPGAMIPVRYNPQNPQELTIDFRAMGFM